MREPAVIYGGSVAALVAAGALGAAGRPVRLLLPQRVGGGFSAMRHEGRSLDLGARLLELGYEDEPETVPPLADYAPGIGGHRPYVRLIREWVQDLVGDGLREIERPQMVLGGRWTDDVLFTVDLAGLPGVLDSATRATVAREATAAWRAEGDAGVLGGAGPEGLSFAEASRRNHGETLHGLLAPLAEKFWRGGSDALPATLRRKVWMALFWPRTVAEAVGGETPAFVPHRPLHTVDPTGPGALIAAQLARLDGLGAVSVEPVGALAGLERAAGGVRLDFTDAPSVTTAEAVLATSPAETFAAAGIPYATEKVRSVIAWVEVAEDDVLELAPLVHLLDPELPAARVTTGGGGSPAGRRLLCLELRHDLPEDAIADAVRVSLEGAGILLKSAAIVPMRQVAMPTFAAPTRESLDAFAVARDALRERALAVRAVGPAADFAGDSLNEQVIAGLQVAEALA